MTYISNSIVNTISGFSDVIVYILSMVALTISNHI